MMWILRASTRTGRCTNAIQFGVNSRSSIQSSTVNPRSKHNSIASNDLNVPDLLLDTLYYGWVSSRDMRLFGTGVSNALTLAVHVMISELYCYINWGPNILQCSSLIRTGTPRSSCSQFNVISQVMEGSLAHWWSRSNPHWSHSFHLPVVDWPNPHTLRLQSTFVQTQSRVDGIALGSIHIQCIHL